MRKLKFVVDDLSIKQDRTCSFHGLFPGPDQWIEAEFTFSKIWDGVPKVAAFYSMMDKEFTPQIINEDNRCVIPSEALKLPAFKMQILGNKRGKIMTTNTMTIYQKGGKV